MNRVIISGKLLDEGPTLNDERLLVIETIEVTPKTVLIKTKLTVPISVGDIMEGQGEISDPEPLTIDGKPLMTPDGRRQVMRNVVRLTELVVINRVSVSSRNAASVPRKQDNSSAEPPKPSSVRSTFIKPAEKSHVYNGPELPWAKRI